jgi:hypothetical protein
MTTGDLPFRRIDVAAVARTLGAKQLLPKSVALAVLAAAPEFALSGRTGAGGASGVADAWRRRSERADARRRGGTRLANARGVLEASCSLSTASRNARVAMVCNALD